MFILSLPDRTLSDTQPQRASRPAAQPVAKKQSGAPGRGAGASTPRPVTPQAKSKGLGALVQRYNARPLSWSELLRLAALGCLAVFGPLGYGAWQMQVIQAERGIVAAQAASQVWYLLALAGVGVFGLLVIVRLSARRGFVAVHENGLAVRHAWGSVRRLSWNAISGIASEQNEQYFLGWQVNTRYQATLIPTTGKPVHLPDGLEGYAELISRLKACLYPRLLTGLETDLEAGKSLYFGPLAISQRGLSYGSQRWRWAEVEYLDIQNGRLEIKPNDQRSLRFSSGQIPNLEILLQLVSKCAPERAGA